MPKDTPTPDQLRAAASRRFAAAEQPAPRRKSITRSLNEAAPATVAAGVTHTFADANGDELTVTTYNPSNIAHGVALGRDFTQVTVKFPGTEMGDLIAAAMADGVGDSISDVVRQWTTVGAQQYLTTKAQATTNPEGTPPE